MRIKSESRLHSLIVLFCCGVIPLAASVTYTEEPELTLSESNSGQHYHETQPEQGKDDTPVSTTPASAGKNMHLHEYKRPQIESNLIPRDIPFLHIIGKEKKYYIGLGGSVKGTVSYDFGNVLDNPNEFIVSEIPMVQGKGDGGLYQISAQQTELYLMGGFNPGSKYEVVAYVNGRFLGNNYNFELENAYVSFMGFTAGYGYGLFCDTWACPTTIDYQGPNAMLTVTSGILNYRYKFGKKWTVGIGAEMPIASFTDVDGKTRTVSQRIPDVPIMVNYEWGDNNRIGAAVVFRGLQYRNLLKSKNETVGGWGLRVSGNGNVAGPVQYFLQGTVGKGLASYIQDLSDSGMDLLPSNTSGKLTPALCYGLMGGLQYNISSKFFATTAYSHVRVYPKKYTGGDVTWGDQYSYGQYVVGNIFWNITPIVQCGIEYLYGRRVNMNGMQAHDNRIQSMLQVCF